MKDGNDKKDLSNTLQKYQYGETLVILIFEVYFIIILQGRQDHYSLLL